MTTRREILERSLAKKKEAFNAKLNEHIADVIGARELRDANRKFADAQNRNSTRVFAMRPQDVKVLNGRSMGELCLTH